MDELLCKVSLTQIYTDMELPQPDLNLYLNLNSIEGPYC